MTLIKATMLVHRTIRRPRIFACLVALAGLVTSAAGQTTAQSVKAVLDQRTLPRVITSFQLQSHLARRIPRLPSSINTGQWLQQEAKLRHHVLADIAFHGWPREWVEAAPRFEQTGIIDTSNGYRLRKFRYDIVPGFQSTAVLYEPQNIRGKAPAILNVIGHEPDGNAAEYEQKRCINFAKRGIFALSLSWPGFGELAQRENAHDYAAYLDLVGSNALGFFYLTMRRGLDYLSSLPQVDRTRLGVTGLSGGGWQTTVLSALDDRVAVSAEVAGIGALPSNLVRPVDTDEIEENATDLTQGQDYPFFVAMRAPRPTLLIHNAEDDCCFRATLVKPYIYDQVRPFFRTFGKDGDFGWHENRDPGTHNYQLDNRQQAYAFFTHHFGLPVSANEIPSDGEIRPPEQLASGLPAGNLTILGLARKLAQQVARTPVPEVSQRSAWAQGQREQLRSVIRYAPVSVQDVWRLDNTKHLGFETLLERFDFSNGLSATGVWLKSISTPQDAPVTIVLNDEGYKAAAQVISGLINRGQQVLAVDLIFNGATAPENNASWQTLVATTGDRPLGLEVAQLSAVASWLRTTPGSGRINVVTEGTRNRVIALTAAALAPQIFASIESHGSIASLDDLLKRGVPFRAAPELFCLDLYKYFDMDRLALMAAPTEVGSGAKPVEKGEADK
ncbi:MAG TPA: acetylxylan esterase [Terriglobia bacterium]|nr:acetylxylan esterase [Terriglobia bacterium]